MVTGGNHATMCAAIQRALPQAPLTCDNIAIHGQALAYLIEEPAPTAFNSGAQAMAWMTPQLSSSCAVTAVGLARISGGIDEDNWGVGAVGARYTQRIGMTAGVQGYETNVMGSANSAVEATVGLYFASLTFVDLAIDAFLISTEGAEAGFDMLSSVSNAALDALGLSDGGAAAAGVTKALVKVAVP
jgi:hypothetical protein